MDATTTYSVISQLDCYVEGFKPVSNNQWAMRCPLCGDSKKNKNKKRGYIYNKDGNYRYHCFNCGQDMDLKWFLKQIAPELYRECVGISVLKKPLEQPQKPEKKICVVANDVSDLERLDASKSEHPGVQYLLGRGVPVNAIKKVYWTNDFKKIVTKAFGEKYEKIKDDLSGLVFPLYEHNPNNPSGVSCVGFQYRTIDPECDKHKRFVTCMADGHHGFFGYNTLDMNEHVYVVEGPIDSLFLPNACAAMTSTLWRLDIPDAIYINDNEPRNKEVAKQVKKCIDKGLRVCLLPDKYSGMDINDIVKHDNLTEAELVCLIRAHTYSGLTARMKYSSWIK